MNFQILIILIAAIAVAVFNRWLFEVKRKQRRDYYRNDYLKSDAWKRKRYVVLKRDNWRCVYCGAQQKVLCNWGYTEVQSPAVHIQALYPADGILLDISS